MKMQKASHPGMTKNPETITKAQTGANSFENWPWSHQDCSGRAEQM